MEAARANKEKDATGGRRVGDGETRHHLFVKAVKLEDEVLREKGERLQRGKFSAWRIEKRRADPIEGLRSKTKAMEHCPCF